MSEKNDNVAVFNILAFTFVGKDGSRKLPTERGEAGRNTKAERRGKVVRHPDSARGLIQQAMHQILSRKYELTFSEHSYGFRRNRSAHDAVEAAQRHINAGNKWVVDIDMAKFFDTVNHDRLMARMKQQISDKRVLRLVNLYKELVMAKKRILWMNRILRIRWIYKLLSTEKSNTDSFEIGSIWHNFYTTKNKRRVKNV